MSDGNTVGYDTVKMMIIS